MTPMMWQLVICSFYYPNGVLFCPFEGGHWAYGNEDLTQTLFNKRLGNPARGVLFTSPNFNSKFELNASCPT